MLRKYWPLALLLLPACSSQPSQTRNLEARIDSLQQQLAHSYRPGLGEFMTDIQVHHAKLWFAGQSQNWKLAGFELGEIREALDGIRQYNTDRTEIKALPMLMPPLDSLDSAVSNKNLPAFRSGYTLLTNTCNNCHHATEHEFNVIRTPDTPPFSNQEFRPQ